MVGSWTVTFEGETVGFIYTVRHPIDGVVLFAAVFEPSRWETPIVRAAAELALSELFADGLINVVSSTVLGHDTKLLELCCDLGAEPSPNNIEVTHGGEIVPAVMMVLLRARFYDLMRNAPSIVRVVSDIPVEDLG